MQPRWPLSEVIQPASSKTFRARLTVLGDDLAFLAI
jgi:hypothetical protein